MEAEGTRDAERACVTTVVPRTQRARCILEHPQSAAFGERKNRIEIGAQAEEVDGNDSDRAVRDERVDLLDVDVERVEVDVAEDGLRTDVLDDVGRRDPREPGTITSSPGPSPSAATATCSAVVQELVATACAAPGERREASSNCFTNGPCTTHSLSSGSWTARSSSGPKNGE